MGKGYLVTNLIPSIKLKLLNPSLLMRSTETYHSLPHTHFRHHSVTSVSVCALCYTSRFISPEHQSTQDFDTGGADDSVSRILRHLIFLRDFYYIP